MTRGVSNERPAWDSASHVSARYRSALREAAGRVPEHQIDWDAFHARLGARTELALARLRHPQLTLPSLALADDDRWVGPSALAWWEHAARWSRPIVTASVAAGIALTRIVRASPKDTSDGVVAATVVVATTAASSDAPRAAFESAVIGHSPSSSMSAALLPTATDLLIPLGKGGSAQ